MMDPRSAFGSWLLLAFCLSACGDEFSAAAAGTGGAGGAGGATGTGGPGGAGGAGGGGVSSSGSTGGGSTSHCGDEVVDPGERCDDGNTVNGDGCNPTCTLTTNVTTFAGTLNQPGTFDGVGASARFVGTGSLLAHGSHLWLAESAGNAHNAIRRITVTSALVETLAGGAVPGHHDDPVGLLARFDGPQGLATDGTTLWIADSGNYRIRAMSLTAPHAVETVAGSGAPGSADGVGAAAAFDQIRDLAFHGGYVYALDSSAATLRRFDPATGEVMTVAGSAYDTGNVDGIGPAAKLLSPRYLSSSGTGMLYISDTNGFTIRTFEIATGKVGTFAGSGAQGYVDGDAGSVLVHRPRGITTDGISVYWAETHAHTVRQGVLATGAVSTLAGIQDLLVNSTGGHADGLGAEARFAAPFGLVHHQQSGSLFLYDSGNNVIRRID